MNSYQWNSLLDNEIENVISLEANFFDLADLTYLHKNNSKKMQLLKENYKRTIRFAYSLASSLKKEISNPLKLSVLKMFHNELFNGLDKYYPGEFRDKIFKKNLLVIESPENPKKWMNFFEEYITYSLEKYNVIQAITRIYIFFLSIKPFVDGNIIIGSIYMNFLLLILGYSNMIIKSTKLKEINKVIHSFKVASTGIEELFKNEAELSFEDKIELIEKGNFSFLEEIIYLSIKESTDYLIMTSTENKNFFSVNSIAKKLNITEAGVKKRIKTGKLIASKMNTNEWHIFPYNVFNTV